MGAANPHLKYFEGNRYGYDVYEVSTLTTFHVDRGKPGSYEDPATITSAAQYRRH